MNEIRVIPKEIGNLIKSESLILGYNKIISTSKELSNLTELTYLDISRNQIKMIPKEIYGMYSNLYGITKLETLDLYCNQIEDINELIEILTFNMLNNVEIKIENIYLWNNLIIPCLTEKELLAIEQFKNIHYL